MKIIYAFAAALLAAGSVYGQTSYMYDAANQSASNPLNAWDIDYSLYPDYYYGVKTSQPDYFSAEGDFKYNFSVFWNTANSVWEFSSQSGTVVSTRVVKSSNPLAVSGDNMYSSNGSAYLSSYGKYPTCDGWSDGYTMVGACMKAIKVTASGSIAQYDGTFMILKRFTINSYVQEQQVNGKPRYVGKSGSDSLQYVYDGTQWVYQKKDAGTGGPWNARIAAVWETLATNSNDTPSVPANGWTVPGGGSLSNDGSVTPLPVKWVSFTARPGESGAVTLEWQTSAETNSDFFDVERSHDGKSFAAIGQLKSAGNFIGLRTYAHVDASAPAGLVYYRLKQVDVDGSYAYSTIVSAKVSGQAHGIFPNPVARGSAFSLNIDEPRLARVQLYDLAGREYPVRTEGLTGKALKISPAQALTPGMYLVRVSSETGAAVHKIMVQ